MKSGQALINEIDSTLVPPGRAAFWWLGQMSFVVKAGGKIIYIDPYLAPRPTRQVPPLLDPALIQHADLVLTTHDHSDHLDPVAIVGIAQASPQALFVCSQMARAKMLNIGVSPGRIVSLDEGMAHIGDGIRIIPIAAKHEFFNRDPQLGHPYLMFVVEVGGVTLLHAGDTLCYDGLLAKLARWKFDLIFLPINGRDAVRYARRCLGNMTYQEAVDLAGELQPGLTVPGHYEMFANNSQDPQPFADYMDVKYPNLRYWIGEHGEKVILQPLDDGQR